MRRNGFRASLSAQPTICEKERLGMFLYTVLCLQCRVHLRTTGLLNEANGWISSRFANI